MSDHALAEWEDPRTQIVYEIMCDPEEPPNPEEHWEGWKARRIVAALNGWQPIETAPMDTNVLMAWLYDGVWEVKSGWAGSTKGGYLHSQATHWMPLPAPPVEAKSEVVG